jgi:hypothetical protein
MPSGHQTAGGPGQSRVVIKLFRTIIHEMGLHVKPEGGSDLKAAPANRPQPMVGGVRVGLVLPGPRRRAQ